MNETADRCQSPQQSCAICSVEILETSEKWSWDTFFNVVNKNVTLPDSISFNCEVQHILCGNCLGMFDKLVMIHRQLEQLQVEAAELRERVKSNFELSNPNYVYKINYTGSIIADSSIEPYDRIRCIIAKAFCQVPNSLAETAKSHFKEENHEDDYPEDELDYPAPLIQYYEKGKIEPEGLESSNFQSKDAVVILKRLPSDIYDEHMKKLKDFQVKYSKKHRMRRKAVIRRIICPYQDCQHKIGFATGQHLHSHIKKVHEGITHPFTCEECGRKFKQPKLYELHLRSHQGDYAYICKYCNAGFMFKSSLRLHEFKHTSEMPYKCDLCDKAYKGHNGLNYHKRTTHTMVKSHVCETCGKTFVSSDKLKRHIGSVHATVKPLMCHLCGKSFAIQNYLYMHMRVHEGNPCVSKSKKNKFTKNSPQQQQNNEESQATVEGQFFARQELCQEPQQEAINVTDNSVPITHEVASIATTITIPIEGTESNVIIFPALDITAGDISEHTAGTYPTHHNM